MTGPMILLMMAHLASGAGGGTPAPPGVGSAETAVVDGTAESAAGRGRKLGFHGLPDDETLASRGATISNIEIVVDDVFDLDDPAENRLAYRWANHLHRSTRESVIRRQLLFHPGDRYSRRLLDETERILRADRYLFDAVIRPVRYHDNQVDVEVVTKDVWTLSGGVSFGHRGGASSGGFEVHDTNFLGTGKELSFLHVKTVDRTGTTLRYRDPNLTGGHSFLDLGYGDNDDGQIWNLSLTRPFYSLDTRWAASLSGLSDDRIDRRYQRGEIVGSYRHQQELFEVSGGISRGLHDSHAHRWLAGVTFARDLFAPAPDLDPPVDLPADRTLVYPWIGFERVEDAFIEAADLDQIARTEDRYLGLRLTGRLGWSAPLLGGDRNHLIFGFGLDSGWRLRDVHLLEIGLRGDGRRSSDGFENLLISAEVRYYWRDFGKHLFFGRLGLDYGSNLDRDRDLLLGGETGLRGYPLRYQIGDRRVLLTLEQRFFTSWYPFRLMRVGAAVFADIGRSWYTEDGKDLPASGGGILRDVGLGLRLGQVRAGQGSVVHLDLAFPLDGDPSIDNLQWLITTKKSF